MSYYKSFRPREVARELLEEIEAGKRSDFINACIEKYGDTVKTSTKNTSDFPNGQKDFGASNKQKPSSLKSTNPYSDQEVTAYKPQSNPQNTVKQFLRTLQRGGS